MGEKRRTMFELTNPRGSRPTRSGRPLPFEGDPLALEPWLEAETQGDDAGAERALFQLFGALPSPNPSRGFATKVLRAAGLESHPFWNPTWIRRLSLACLVLAGLATAWMPPVLQAMSRWIAPGAMVSRGIQAFLSLTSALDEMSTFWSLLLHLRQAFLLVATTPPIAVTLVAAAALFFWSLLWLQASGGSFRRSFHVEI